MADWARWASRHALTTQQCERAERSLLEGWSAYFLSQDELGAGLSLEQLRSMHREMSAVALPSRARDDHQWSRWRQLAEQGDAAAVDAPVWIAAVARALRDTARLSGIGGDDRPASLCRRLSPRAILHADAKRRPVGWQSSPARLAEVLAPRAAPLPRQQLDGLIEAARPRAEAQAWTQLVSVSRERIGAWAESAVARSLRECGALLPLVAVAGDSGQWAAVAVDADGCCQLAVELNDVPRELPEQLPTLCERVGACHVAVAAGPGAERTIGVLAKLTEDQAIRWRMVDRRGADWWSKSLTAAAGPLSIAARQALFIARRLQDPLATLAEAPAAELAPDGLRELLTKPQRQRLEQVADDQVHSLGLNVRRCGPRALSRLCDVSPLQSRRALGDRDHVAWESLEALRDQLGLGERQWRQTEPFVRLAGQPRADEATDEPSQLAAASAWRQARQPLDALASGQRLSAHVVRVTDFGAFVDIGAEVRALVHIAELSSGFLADPLEVVAPGDQLEVELIKVDLEQRRIDARPAAAPRGSRSASRGGNKPPRGGSKARRSGKQAAKQAAKPRRSGRKRPEQTPEPPEPPAPPITEEMAEGKAPLRSFSDLVQFYDRKRSQEDSSS